ncbi:hypothetical protein MMC10_004074 [Thelotrema lepadinum]|nr:hypothetical protein [Thelotrema lepadinum]
MAMSNWRLLASEVDTVGKPSLLVRFEMQATEYSVHVTDLIYLWSETLNRKSIVRRAIDEDTSIDPSEGRDQLNLLLRHLWTGLNGDPDTKLNISSTSDGKGSIRLGMTSVLPPPLTELSWSFQLNLASQTEFSRQVLVPIVGNLFSARKDASSLMSMVRAKDDALSRIKSSLDSGGRSIPELFRAIIPKTSKEAAEEALLQKVPGLVPFDEDDWAEMQSSSPAKDFREICEGAFREGQPELPTEAVHSSQTNEAWWENLGSGVDVVSNVQPSPSKPPLLHQETSSAGFATQDSNVNETTPPSPTPVRQETKEGNDDAEDSDATASTASDLDEDVIKSPPPAPAPMPSPQPPRKLGMFGSKKDTPKPPSPSPAQTPSKHTNSAAPASSPARKSPPRVSAPPSSAPAPSSSTPTKQKGKLGRIGGSQIPASSSSQSKNLSQSHQLTSRSGLGQIDSEDEDGGEDQNEIEAADRRREELKRRLEEKKNAPTKKKPRKF